MIEVRLASEPVPGGGPNEDCGFAVPGLVGALDGVTVPVGLDTGCVHGPAWYARMLAGRLIAGHAADPEIRLDRLLAAAIAETSRAHGGRCDLDNPGTPASTVCLVGYRADRLDYLVLGDSPLVYLRAGRVDLVNDLRVQRVGRALGEFVPPDAPVGGPEHTRAVRERIAAQQGHINRPDGYWIASTEPAAAGHALTGSLPLTGADPVRRACLLTDGASRAVDTFDLYDWPGLLDTVVAHGPAYLIERVRAAERAQPQTRIKQHDDATAALIRFDAGDEGDPGRPDGR